MIEPPILGSSSPQGQTPTPDLLEEGQDKSRVRWRLAILNSHPVQYFAPFYARLARDPEINLTVLYCTRGGLSGYRDQGFGEHVRWDIPLLEGYRHEFLSNLTGHDSPRGFWSVVNPGVARRIWSGCYDAVWVHGHNYFTTLLAVLSAKIIGTPVFMRAETHLLLRRGLLKRWLRPRLLRTLYGLCDAFLTIGSRNSEFYRQIGVPDRKQFLVPYCVDNDFFASFARGLTSADKRKTRRELGLPAEVPVALFVGKLVPRKRPADLLAAYARLRSGGIEAAVVFAGSGEQEGALRRWVRARDHTYVYFIGFQNQTELARLYAVADVMVLPSENEPWGLVVNEAMAAGLPIITTREIGASADLVRDGENGFVLETGDVARLAECLERLVTDAHLRRRMGAESRRIIEGWGYEQATAGVRAALAAIAPRRSTLVREND